MAVSLQDPGGEAARVLAGSLGEGAFVERACRVDCGHGRAAPGLRFGGFPSSDTLQQGGALVVAPDGTILYRYASRASGDHPDPLDLLAALH